VWFTRKMDKGKGIAGPAKCTRGSLGRDTAMNIVQEMNDSMIHKYSLEDVHFSFLSFVNDLKLRQLLNVGHLLDKGTRVTAKEALEFWQSTLIKGVKDPRLLGWMSTNLLQAQLSARLGDTAAVEEVVRVMGNPGQSTAHLDTLKVAQIIGVQMVLLGASNSFAIHEDIDQINLDIGLGLEQIWSLAKALALESITQGKKLDAIYLVLGIQMDKFEESKLAETLVALVIDEDAHNPTEPTLAVSSSSEEKN
ncbi:hypothetical protein KI387_041231, partial [Taxus chinensis]